MSTSTVSITAANAAAARRRTSAVSEKEKKSSLDVAGAEVAPATGKFVGSAGDTGMDLGHSIRGETVLEKGGRKVGTGNGSSVAVSAGAAPRKGKKRAEKPFWLWLIRVLVKNAIVVMLMVALFQGIRHYAVNQGVTVGFPSGDYEGRIAELQALVKNTVQMMQFQLDAVDMNLGGEVAGLRNRIEDHAAEVASQLDKLGERVGSVEKSAWVGRDEFDKFVEEFKKAKGVDVHGQVNFDEVASFAREMIQKEIEKHAADGLGLVDYALGSAGGFVVEHSMPLASGMAPGWFGNRRVHRDAGKMLRPSHGEPGECFALKGSSGFVQIMLRAAIIPEAVTLEHVAKSVAYDRSSAPKDCRITGWFQNYDTPGSAVDTENTHLLTEFTYDLEKSTAQTFNLLESASSVVVNTIRLDFTSNHGNPVHTCIYRLRVHGHEPEAVPTLAVRS